VIANPLIHRQKLGCGENNGEAIEQVIAHRPPLRGCRWRQQGLAAGVGRGCRPSRLDFRFSPLHSRQAAGWVMPFSSKLSSSDVEDAAMRPSARQPGWTPRRPAARGGHIGLSPPAGLSVTPRGTWMNGAGHPPWGNRAVGSGPPAGSPPRFVDAAPPPGHPSRSGRRRIHMRRRRLSPRSSTVDRRSRALQATAKHRLTGAAATSNSQRRPGREFHRCQQQRNFKGRGGGCVAR